MALGDGEESWPATSCLKAKLPMGMAEAKHKPRRGFNSACERPIAVIELLGDGFRGGEVGCRNAWVETDERNSRRLREIRVVDLGIAVLVPLTNRIANWRTVTFWLKEEGLHGSGRRAGKRPWFRADHGPWGMFSGKVRWADCVDRPCSARGRRRGVHKVPGIAAAFMV